MEKERNTAKRTRNTEGKNSKRNNGKQKEEVDDEQNKNQPEKLWGLLVSLVRITKKRTGKAEKTAQKIGNKRKRKTFTKCFPVL